MDKFAFLTARNKYMLPGNDLHGCVNDVEAMFHLLADVYRFPPDNIRVVTDERATREAILDGLKWLVGHENAELVGYNSSHGSRFRDQDDDAIDDVIIPYDLDPDWNKVIYGHEIGEICDTTPLTSAFTFVSDSCHSGNICREFGNPVRNHPKQLIRYLQPPIDMMLRMRPTKHHPDRITNLGHRSIMRAVSAPTMWASFSGCRDDQTSAECEMQNGQTRGAMTYNLETILKATPAETMIMAQSAVLSALSSEGFEQCPQVMGNQKMVNRNIFGGV